MRTLNDAKILLSNTHLQDKSVEDVMDMDWSHLRNVIVGGREYKNGRLVRIRYYSKIETNGELLSENMCFQKTYLDVAEFTVKNKTFIEIEETDEIILSSSEDVVPIELERYSKKNIIVRGKRDLYEKRRTDLISQMKSKNVHTSIESSVTFLSLHYEAEIRKFIENGTADFKEALIAESNEEVLGHLNSKLVIGYDGVVGQESGTVPINYSVPDGEGGNIELFLRDILIGTISNWVEE